MGSTGELVVAVIFTDGDGDLRQDCDEGETYYLTCPAHLYFDDDGWNRNIDGCLGFATIPYGFSGWPVVCWPTNGEVDFGLPLNWVMT